MLSIIAPSLSGKTTAIRADFTGLLFDTDACEIGGTRLRALFESKRRGEHPDERATQLISAHRDTAAIMLLRSPAEAELLLIRIGAVVIIPHRVFQLRAAAADPHRAEFAALNRAEVITWLRSTSVVPPVFETVSSAIGYVHHLPVLR